MVLLLLCLVTSALGIVCITSATSAAKFDGNARYIILQIVATLMGVFLFAVMSSIDLETLC